MRNSRAAGTDKRRQQVHAIPAIAFATKCATVANSGATTASADVHTRAEHRPQST